MLPRDFIFSQNNLQMYSDCKRLFLLKVIKNLEWPANDTEPVKVQEERMAFGSQFHLLCSQFFYGIPDELLLQSIENDELLRWWKACFSLGFRPSTNHFPEKAITIPFGGFRLTAHFDLLVNEPDGSHTIYDWKTNLKLPSKQLVMNRLQTLVYPVVLGKFLNFEHATNLNQINMIYWYPEFPDQPHKFSFDHENLKQKESELISLIQDISEFSPEDFNMTDNFKRCQICNYRSFCNRGDKAGMNIEDSFLEDSINLV